MDISEDVLTLYHGEVEREDGRYVLEVPEQEVELGEIEEGGVYRVAILPQRETPSSGQDAGTKETQTHEEPTYDGPPVEEGEHRTVDIETIGDQGDGIAKVERGYVIIVPDTKVNERVTVEIADVRKNVAFADVVKRHSYYE